MSGDKALKVYIAVDSEGQACLTREEGPDRAYGPFQAEYNRLRATEEAAAAVTGAQYAGATDILVHDIGFVRSGTPAGLTLYYDELPRGIRIAMGGAPVKAVAAEGFDAAFLLGHHAMAGTADGVMAHTFSSVTIEEMFLNGKPIGEIAVHALQLGVFDIPVVMVSADEAGCREAKEWLGNIELAPVKKGLSTHSAISLHPKDACDLIRSKAKLALQRLKEFAPLKIEGPLELKTNCFTEEQAQVRAQKKGGQLVGPRSYVVQSQNPLDLY